MAYCLSENGGLLVQYDWILFDADETLFSFDAYQGLKTLFSRYKIDFSKVDFEQYQKVNTPLWGQYQKGEITSKQLKENRFLLWSSRLLVSPAELNRQFLDVMAELCQPLKGVQEVIPLLAKKAKLGIITNGFSQMQNRRLENTGLQKYFDLLVVSEEVGFPKPDVRIFEYAFEKMGYPDKSRILMVGDNLHSDILGANLAGIERCWLNRNKSALNTQSPPCFVVKSWGDLSRLLLS